MLVAHLDDRMKRREAGRDAGVPDPVAWWCGKELRKLTGWMGAFERG